MNKNYIVLLAVVFSFLTSCSTKTVSNARARKISEVRLIPPVIKDSATIVSMSAFLNAMNAKGEVNQVRMIEIFRRGQAKDAPPEYRLLDVREKGVFHLLGLRERDVIVAADGFIVPNGQLFWEYVKLIEKTKKASIEIRRGSQALRLNINVID